MATKSVDVLLKEKKIYQVINPKIVRSEPDITLEQAVRLMQDQQSGYIVCVERNKVVGIVTETDIVRKVLEKDVDWKRPLRDIMVPNPKVLSPMDTVGTAIDVMGGYDYYTIPLVDENQNVAGMLSVRTLIRFLAGFYPTEVYNLPPNPNQIMKSPEGG